MWKKGYKQTKEHTEKIRAKNKGRKPARQTIEASVRARKGKPLSEQWRKMLSKSHLGKKHTEETKKKIGLANSVALKGIKHSREARLKMRESHINNPNTVFKDTNIELKIERELRERNISYQKQVPLCKIAIVDFYLPEYRVVIQCDGDYWHGLTGRKERDERQDNVLTFNGFNVYRFWEHEINESVRDCVDKINFLEN